MAGTDLSDPTQEGTDHMNAPTARRLRMLALTLVVGLAGSVVGLGGSALLSGSTVAAASTNISQGKPTTASSIENAGTPAANATDGNTGTRWASAFSNPQWLQVDLGATASVTGVTLIWEAAYGKAFQIQTSPNATTWTSIYSTTTGTGGTQTLTVSGTGRYVRMYGTVRGNGYGYSLWEFQVFGSFGTATPTPPVTATPAPTGTATAAPTATPTATATGAACGTTNVALNKTATASSIQGAGYPASAAFDGSATTRWSSAASDPQWLQVDLGSTQSICKVVLNWEAAYGKSFQIQTSNDATNWTSIYSTTTGTGGIQTLAVAGTGRYVRMYGTVRGTGYGYSLWEFQVFGSFGPIPTPSPTQVAGCGTNNVAQGKTATASSIENVGTPASAAFDGNTGTRWSSAFSDPQWVEVDLGSPQPVCRVNLNWETAYARSFQIQVSTANENWNSIYSTPTGAGGVKSLSVSGTGRYVRMYGTVRNTVYGYSLWEFAVYTGVLGPTPVPTATPTGVPTPTASSAPGTFWDNSNIPAATQVMTFKFLNRTNGKYPDSQVLSLIHISEPTR